MSIEPTLSTSVAAVAGAAASPRTRAEQLREALADDILSGRLGPGARLDEQALADRFGVSRTPVREALRQLAATGLVAVRPHRGAEVSRVSTELLAAMFEAMAELEATCARLAARKMTAVERRRLETLHRGCGDLVRGGDPESYHRANLDFHAAIYAGAHNTILADMTVALRTRLAPFRRAQFRTMGRLGKSFAEHDGVVQAILRGDGEDAGRMMRDHVTLVGDAFNEYAQALTRLAATRS